ncbi:major outer membrane protein, partial [Poseidonibacter sp.]|uniref:major outer membrane protein n=1 Tax=Poseidonibacter sp. TaxID=2321188 RepID=UPI003C710D4E
MKITKLSMVAALAVSCLSTASAKDLAEAIKNVDVSGTAAYRYNDYEGASDASNNYKIAATLKSKVNDDITFNSRIIIGDGKTNPKSINTNDADTEAEFALSEVNF